MNSPVMYVRLSQVPKAVKLSILAQKFMDGKKFGLCVWGQSGIGKTSITDGLAEDFSKLTNTHWDMLDCNLSSSTPEDVNGFPHITDGVLKFIQQWNLGKNSNGIFRIDEFDRPAYFQNLIAIAKFAIDRQTENALPENWFVLALGNGISDAHTQELTEHLKGRFVHIYVSTNGALANDERLAYLESKNLPKSVLNFERMNPIKTRDEFEPHAVDNNRTRVYAYAILKAYDTLKKMGKDYSDVLLPVLAGAIGKNQACELLKLVELENLPTLDEVIANPMSAIIPDDLSLRHKFVSVLVHEAQNDCQKAVKLMDYLVRLPNEVARYAIENLSTACPEVCKCKTYVTWSNRIN